MYELLGLMSAGRWLHDLIFVLIIAFNPIFRSIKASSEAYYNKHPSFVGKIYM
jgi:hypothetical protein